MVSKQPKLNTSQSLSVGLLGQKSLPHHCIHYSALEGDVGWKAAGTLYERLSEAWSHKLCL